MPNNDCLEDRTPEIVIRKPLCWAPAGSTSFDVCIERLSGGTLNITGGALTATGLAVPSTGATPPTPLAANPCPTGLAAFFWFQDANGNYRPAACLDETTGIPNTASPAAPPGTVVHCWREWWDDSGIAGGGAIRNALLSVGHIIGHGGQVTGGTVDERSIAFQMQNNDPAFQTIRQATSLYGELLLTLTPTFLGVAGGEVNAGVVRGSMSDARTGGASPPSKEFVFSSQFTRDNAGAFTGGGGYMGGFRHNTLNNSGGNFAGITTFQGYLADGIGNNGGATGFAGYEGFTAFAMSSRFPFFNVGFRALNFGTSALDNNIQSEGVNANGTAAGFNVFIGPTTLGSQTHATSGIQLRIEGGDIDFRGTTSGNARLGIAAVAGTPNRLLLPTTTGSSGALLTTDGANPQQLSWNTNLNSVADLTATTYKTTTICTNAGGSCAGTRAGMVTIGAAATTVTVTTGGVGGSSQIMVMEDSSLGAALGVTCNTTLGRNYAITQRTGGVNFVISTDVAPAVNPACLSFWIIN